MHQKSTHDRDAAPSSFDPRVESLAMDLLHERGDQLLRYARRHSDNEADADDAFQNAFLIFLAKFDFDDVDRPLAWLTTVLKHECLARRRAHRHELQEPREVTLPSGEPAELVDLIPDHRHGPEELAEIDDAANYVGRLLAQLKPDERKALTLKALGYSYAEMAEITGWSHTKINRLMVEGRARLRELIADE